MRKRIGAFLGLLLAAAMLTIPSPAQAILRATEDPAENPDLEKSCGLDILLILDESGSIESAGAADDVRNAYKAFTDALKNTSSRLATVEFAIQARLPSIGGLPGGSYITVTDASKATMDDYVDNEYDPGGNTNWEDALRMGNFNFAPRPTTAVPHLTVIITDGDPTQMIRGSRVTEFEYANKVPLDDNETENAGKNEGANAAVPNANGLKAQGSHILAIGVGKALQNQDSVDRLERISGPDIYDGSGDFDIATDDIFLEEDFEKLEDALREAAFQLCAPSVTIQKLVDITPDPGTLDDAVPGVGWEITGEPFPQSGFPYDWVLPPTGPAQGPRTTTTDSAGFATFQWTLGLPVASPFEASELIQAGYTNLPDETTCTYRTPDIPDTDLPVVAGNGTFEIDIPTESIVTCTFYNLAPQTASIDLEKHTQGVDADIPDDAPLVGKDKPIAWSYRVTNTGSLSLTGVGVVDTVNQPAGLTAPSVTCPKTELAQGESMLCYAFGTAGYDATGTEFGGLYGNTATVSATSTTGTSVSDSDPSHYFVSEPGIHVEKGTASSAVDPVPADATFHDSDLAPGEYVPVGDFVAFRYVLTNQGTVPLDDIVLSDSVEGVLIDGGTTRAACDWAVARTLDPGESTTCILATTAGGASFTAQDGQYVNIATATGTAPDATTVTDQDPSHYFGARASVEIEKSTNGEDADTPTGPIIRVGDPVVWRYEVTNTGNVPLQSWSVSDDQLGPISCPRIALVPGASTSCSSSGVAEPGQYANTGTVTAVNIADPGGPSLTDDDPSHYYGAEPRLTIEKATNSIDADLAPGPLIEVGGAVTWTYVVTNTGNVPLDDLEVIDDQEGVVTATCDRVDLPIGASATCTWPGSPAIAGQYENRAVATAYSFVGPVVATDPSHYFGVEGQVDIQKYTNGIDADSAPGVPIPAGDPVEWEYVVTNIGNSPISSIVVTDDIEGQIDTCPSDTLPAGGTMTCVYQGIAVQGQYANVATVEALDAANSALTDTDPSHYHGYISAIDVEKSTNGEDADTGTGPHIAEGDIVTWLYVVTNPGDQPIEYVVVTDDQGIVPIYVDGDANADGYLDPSEIWTYTATGTAEIGQYENLATVVGVDPFEQVVTDDDPSHYFGFLAGVDVEKSTNGEDADTPTGPTVAVGETVTWTYVVTNTGTVPVANLVVTDDQGVTPVYIDGDANSDDLLDVDETWTYEASGSAIAGQYANLALATATDPVGAAVSDEDPSHYYGFDASIQIEKTPDVAVVESGASHEFTIEVTNTGDSVLTDVVVTDPATPSCDRAIGDMQPGEVVTYTCDVASVTNAITNVAFVTGLAVDGSERTDDDDAWVGPFGVGGTGTIGDTVWADYNANGVQDAGEPGIAGATVTVTYIDTGAFQTYTTDADGTYLAVGLVAGTYSAEVDETSVDGDLTTAGRFTIPLAAGEEYLDADFGFDDTLPATGADSARIVWLALVLLLAGGALVASTRFLVVRRSS